MSVIVDLYSKFLIAFIGIVTPALALYLNNNIIDFKKFHYLVKKMKDNISKQYQVLNSVEAVGDEEKELRKRSNLLLEKDNRTLENWAEIVEKLSPRIFFKENLLLLFIAMLFLVLFLLAKELIKSDNCYFLLALILTSSISLGACIIHILNLIRVGFNLIDIKNEVVKINKFISEGQITYDEYELEELI